MSQKRIEMKRQKTLLFSTPLLFIILIVILIL